MLESILFSYGEKAMEFNSTGEPSAVRADNNEEGYLGPSDILK